MDIVDIIFVIGKNDTTREVVAIMPGLAATIGNVNHCTCYVHIGQHSAADIDVIYREYENAQPAEYADLLQELCCIGYNVNVVPFTFLRRTYYTKLRRQQLEF